MARVTIEDCLEKIPNTFQLITVAAKRAKQIANGAPVLVEEENDKPTVLALREIAEGLVDASILVESETANLDELIEQELESADQSELSNNEELIADSSESMQIEEPEAQEE
jgi:DNA-directed RNA polymerase subunit omega